MDDFRRNLSPPASIKASATKKSSQSDPKPRFHFSSENDHQMGPKKPMLPKHFMSPTISAESKAKRRILMEKSTPPSEDMGGLGFRYPLSPLSSNIPESYHHDDSASLPYDPVKNYLSPRPTFRLYDPNKRAQMKRVGNGMFASQVFDEITASPGSSPSQEIEEGQEMDEFEEDEEVVEEKNGFLNKVLKFLVVLSALFLSTLYISSMNSTSIPALSLRPQWDLKDVYSKIQDGGFRVSVNDFVPGSMVFNHTEEQGRNLMEETDSVIHGGVAKNDAVQQVSEKPGLSFDQAEVSNEGESVTKTLDSVHVSETQVLPNSVVYTDEMLDDKPLMFCESNRLFTENIGTVRDEVVVQHESLGVSENSGGFSCKIDEKKIILGDIIRTCEINGNLGNGFSDQVRNVDSIVKKEVVVIGGIALLTAIMGCLYLKYRKLSKEDSSSVIQPYAESRVLEEDRRSQEDECIEEKEEFVKAHYHVSPLASLHSEEQRLVELYQSRVPTVQLLGEYEVTTKFTRSSPISNRRELNPAESQWRKREISPTIPSVSQFYSATVSNSNGRFTPQLMNENQEERSSGEELVKERTTALRRSNRLRNKTVVSPKF